MGCNSLYWRSVDFIFMIRRTLYFLVGFLLAANAVFAFADRTCPPSVQKYMSSGQFFGDPASACAANSQGYSNISAFETSPGSWKCSQGIYGDARAYVLIVNLCDDLTSPDSRGMCECPDPCKKWAGYYHNGGSPSSVRLPGGDAGGDRNYYSGTGTSVPESICIDNCVANFANTVDMSVVAGSYWSVAANPIFSGNSCNTSTPSSNKVLKNTPEFDCVSSGKAFGYVNGSVLCVTAQAGKDTSTKTNTTQNADGTSTKVDVTKVLNCTGDGSCVTQTTTTTTTISSSGVPGTSYTTQTVEKSTGTSASGTGAASQSSSFCKDNPQSPFCKTGFFNGTCASEPACDGDPVMCATAKATWMTKCSVATDQATIDKGNTALSGGDQATKDATKRNQVTIDRIDASPSGGACLPDQTIPMGDLSIVIPFSSLCPGIDLIRVAVIAVAGFTALMIVIGGIK